MRQPVSTFARRAERRAAPKPARIPPGESADVPVRRAAGQAMVVGALGAMRGMMALK